MLSGVGSECTRTPTQATVSGMATESGMAVVGPPPSGLRTVYWFLWHSSMPVWFFCKSKVLGRELAAGRAFDEFGPCRNTR